jgi:hypothetical protein
MNPIIFANLGADKHALRMACPTPNPTSCPSAVHFAALTALTSSSFFRMSGSGPTGVMLKGFICL